jgi:hypothetical protein
MGHNKRLNPKKTLALRCFFSPVSETYNHIGKTARHVGCGPNTLRRWLDSPQAQDVRSQVEAEGREAALISVRMVQERLWLLAEKAEAERKYGAAVNALATLLKSLGGFMADRLPPENLAGKMLDAEKMADLRAIADRYYTEKYLATKPKVMEQEILKTDATTPQPAVGSNKDTGPSTRD